MGRIPSPCPGPFEARFPYAVCCKAMAVWLSSIPGCFPYVPSLLPHLLPWNSTSKLKCQHLIPGQRLCFLGNPGSWVYTTCFSEH